MESWNSEFKKVTVNTLIIFLGSCYHFNTLFDLCLNKLDCFLPIFYLESWHSFAKLLIISKPFLMYIYVRFDCLAYTYQDLYHLAGTLANTNSLLVSDLCHLAITLTNSNDMLKINLCYLVSTLTNTIDKADNFTRRRSIVFNQLFTPHH